MTTIPSNMNTVANIKIVSNMYLCSFLKILYYYHTGSSDSSRCLFVHYSVVCRIETPYLQTMRARTLFRVREYSDRSVTSILTALSSQCGAAGSLLVWTQLLALYCLPHLATHA